jgi:hypothetical protein
LKELVAQHDCENETDTSDLELNVWEEKSEDSEDHNNDEEKEIPPGNGCRSVASVVCCQVEVSATG